MAALECLMMYTTAAGGNPVQRQQQQQPAPPPPPVASASARSSGAIPTTTATRTRRSSPPETQTSSTTVSVVDCHDHWACEAYGRVCPSSARNAGRAARRALDRLVRDSELLPARATVSSSTCRRRGEGDGTTTAATACEGEFDVAAIDPSDVVIGRLLGRGGFSEVHEASLLLEPTTCTASASGGAESESDDGKATAGEAKDDDDPNQHHHRRYVVKYLRRSAMVDRKKFARGASDLAIEASLLSSLNHTNIIRLHGVTSGSVETNFGTARDASFFLLLDRLTTTLDVRIQTWKGNSIRYSTSFVYRATHDPRGCKRRAALLDRLRVASSLAGAVHYLHSKNVAYRDLKPENIGFDSHDVLKLYDFGLAKELKPARRLPDGTYKLTGNTGSRRYMAPEVALDKPYNLTVDAYSFGVLLWEICCLEKPFGGYSETQHREQIVEGGERPPLDGHSSASQSFWPRPLRDLIGHCWAQDIRDRPSFGTIIEDLGRCLGEEQEGNASCPPLDASSSSSSLKASKKISRKRVGSFVKRRSASERLSSSSSERHGSSSYSSEKRDDGSSRGRDFSMSLSSASHRASSSRETHGRGVKA